MPKPKEGMTLGEAIKGLTWLKDEAIFPKNQADTGAMGLGIEAMKLLEQWRVLYPDLPQTPLPGETED